MLHIGLPHVNVLSKLDLVSKYGELGESKHCQRSFATLTGYEDFNLDFYTEVQDLSHLSNVLSETHPRYGALTMAICDLVEDFGLVGFETLAVEDKKSMLHLMRVVDRALGYAFVADQQEADQDKGQGAPANALFSSALSSIPGAANVRDVQERWIDEKEKFDAWEEGEWRREGVAAAEEKAREKASKQTKTVIRKR